MTYDQLSDEAKEILQGMVEFCVRNRICMGMDCGEDMETGKDHNFVEELRQFSGA